MTSSGAIRSEGLGGHLGSSAFDKPSKMDCRNCVPVVSIISIDANSKACFTAVWVSMSELNKMYDWNFPMSQNDSLSLNGS